MKTKDDRAKELNDLANIVRDYLNEMARRAAEGPKRSKRVRDLRIATMVAFRLAYSLGRTHVFEEFVEESIRGDSCLTENGHERMN